jgi:D-lactate dehydrogenase (cytochrome)
MRAGIPVAAMEIMDEVQMYVVNKSASTSRKWKEAPTLFFKYVWFASPLECDVKLR